MDQRQQIDALVKTQNKRVKISQGQAYMNCFGQENSNKLQLPPLAVKKIDETRNKRNSMSPNLHQHTYKMDKEYRSTMESSNFSKDHLI